MTPGVLGSLSPEIGHFQVSTSLPQSHNGHGKFTNTHQKLRLEWENHRKILENPYQWRFYSWKKNIELQNRWIFQRNPKTPQAPNRERCHGCLTLSWVSVPQSR
jgi:hypothetical protein